MEFVPYVTEVEKEIYTIRTRDGKEMGDYYPNGGNFHRTKPHAENPAVVPKSEVTHVALQSRMEDYWEDK